MGLFAASCSDLGFQGGIIPTNFQGITSLVAISPESVQMNWDPYPGATQYKVYTADLNDPINDRVGFTTFITKPVGAPREDGTYLFSATAVDPTTGLDQGDRSSYLSVRLLPRLTYHRPSNEGGGKVTALNTGNNPTGAVRVTWTAYPLVNYQVYVTERKADGSVNFNFNTSSASVTGQGSVDITGLLKGRSYCAIVVANYLDSTRDGPNGQKLTVPLSNLVVGPGGGFGGSVISTVINESEKCARTTASTGFAGIQANSTVYASVAVPSTKPTFFAVVGQNDTSENGSGDAKISVYREDPVTRIGTLVGERIGFGKITALAALPPGRHKFYAVLEEINGGSAQARLEVRVGGAATSAPSWMFLRGFSQSSDPGHYPELQQRGFGSLRMGSSVAVGDFNCDGRGDIAVGMPEVSETLADNRTAKLGRVMIYYDVRDTSNILPCTRSQSITFDISDSIPEGRDLRLGTELFVGNFNADSQGNNSPPDFPDPTLKRNFTCDDLAIGSGHGPLFVLYGRRDTIPVSQNNSCTSATSTIQTPRPDGGLNYFGPKSFNQNPSAACAPSTGICQPSLFRYQTSSLKLGRAMTSGDFDGDGYLDLAASSTSTSGIWVFRGSEFGLIPPARYTALASETLNTDVGPGGISSFPYLPATTNHFPNLSSISILQPDNSGTNPLGALGWGNGSFGSGLGVLKNAYHDQSTQFGTTWSGTGRVRDVLLIGNPGANNGAGRVIACIPKTAFLQNDPLYGEAVNSTSDSGKALAWDCNHRIDPPSGVGARSFGTSLAGFENALRYFLDEFKAPMDSQGRRCFLRGNSNEVPFDHPNCNPSDNNRREMGFPGAVAIGAPGSSQVFVYYGLHRPFFSNLNGGVCSSDSCNRPALGTSRNRYLTEQILDRNAAALAAIPVADDPCATTTASNITYEQCSVQVVTPPPLPPGQDSGSFGTRVFAFRGNNQGVNTNNPKESVLAVTAPIKSLSIGITRYSQVGLVQLFQQKSVFSNNPIQIGGSMKRFSTGIATSITSTLDYDGPLNDYIEFGGGGVAAGPLEPSPTGDDYAPATDLVVGAPGFVRPTDAQGTPIPPVYDNGAAMVYFSHGGTYRNFRVTQPSGPDSKWHLMSSAVSSDGLAQPIGQESDTRFHQVISIGDVDRDGIGDVAVRISRGSTRNSIRIYPGAECSDASKVSCQVGLKKSSTSVMNLSVPDDPTAGYRFVPAGRLKGGTGEAFFITGLSTSYLYFGGTTGIIPGNPSNSGSPRKFERPTRTPKFLDNTDSNARYLTFGDASFYHRESLGITTTLNNYLPFARGDFNGDGFQDFAFAQSDSGIESAGIVDSTAQTALASSTNPSSAGSGRVYVWYGGAENGFQVQVDQNGGYPIQRSYRGLDGNIYGFSPLSQTLNLGLPGQPAPCSEVNGAWTCNRVQVIAEQGTASFGSSMTSMVVGKCGNNDASALVVRATLTASNQSIIYVYRPNCILDSNSSSLQGLTVEQSTGQRQALNAVNAPLGQSGTIGFSMIFSANLMGVGNAPNLAGHLILADQGAAQGPQIFALPVERANNANLTPAGTVLLPAAGASFTDPAYQALGGRRVNYLGSNFLSGMTGSQAGFGEGMSNLGDFNGDGTDDIAVNISRLNRIESSSTITSQGGLLLLFGKMNSGLQVLNSSNIALPPAMSADCFVRPVSGTSGPLESVCNPTLFFAPQPSTSLRQGAHEYSFLSPYSHVATGTRSGATCQTALSPNDCLGTFVFGVPGRDSIETQPNRPILQGGAFYVAP